MDAVNLGSESLYRFALATSNKGVVTLAWQEDGRLGRLVLSELDPDSWHWSKPEIVASSLDKPMRVSDDIAIAYDGLGRLLVAWTSHLGNDSHNRWRSLVVKERIRNVDGTWQPVRLIARYPRKEAKYVLGPGLTLSSGKRGFALGWYSSASSIEHQYPNVSGFRILDGNKWLPPVHVGAEGRPVRVALLDHQPPLAVWILPLEKKLLSASLRPDGKLGKPRVLGKADSFFATSSDAKQAVAAWNYDYDTWASAWNGRRWTKPKDLGRGGSDSSAFAPIATAVARGRAAVAWQTGGAGSFSLLQRDAWTKAAPFASPPETKGSGAANVGAVALSSGELVLLGIDEYLGVAHLPLRGKATNKNFSIKVGGSQVLASAGGLRAAAFAWEADLGWESSPELHIFVWVYRPPSASRIK